MIVLETKRLNLREWVPDDWVRFKPLVVDRIFPVTELAAIPSRHLEAVMAALRDDGCQVVIETVDYEFQRGGNQMMRIVR